MAIPFIRCVNSISDHLSINCAVSSVMVSNWLVLMPYLPPLVQATARMDQPAERRVNRQRWGLCKQWQHSKQVLRQCSVQRCLPDTIRIPHPHPPHVTESIHFHLSGRNPAGSQALKQLQQRAGGSTSSRRLRPIWASMSWTRSATVYSPSNRSISLPITDKLNVR